MRAASILLFAGGTALSPAPQTISVGLYAAEVADAGPG